MPKWIAISPHLDGIKDTLEQKGYKTVGIDETNHEIHALIYSSNSGINGNQPNTADLSISGSNKFVIMINADELSTDEIVDMIN